MPRGRPRKSQVDDDEDLSQTQNLSQTQSRSAISLSREEAERLATKVVHFVLKTHALGKPLRRNDIRKEAVPEQYWRCFKEILETAKRKLEHVLGMSLEVMPNKANLILVNQLSVAAEDAHVKLPDSELQQRGLLIAVLTLIFMNNGSVKEELLWAFLKKLGVENGMKHECFGDVNKLLSQDFVRADYLKVEKKTEGDKTTREFSWGDAANTEVNQMDILQFFCNIWGGEPEPTQPEDWLEQYDRAMASTSSAGDQENQ